MRSIFLSLATLIFSSTILAATMSFEDIATMPSLSSPRLSPDGRRVAFVVTLADLERSRYESEIWLVGADGSRPFPLAHAGDSNGSPQWSPAGKLAFLSNRAGTTQIWLIDPDGGEAVQLSRHPGGVNEFRWSADGTAIAFVARDPDPPELVARRRERDDARVWGEAQRWMSLPERPAR